MKAGWKVLPLAEFAKTGAGGTPNKANKEFYEGGEIPWLLSGEVANANITTARNFITSEGLKGSSAKLFPPNSVLVAMYGATAGEVGILRFEAATNQAVCAILPNPSYSTEYLYYFLLHSKPLLVSQAVGNAQPNISQAKIKDLPIPLPPLEVQHQIVAVLDEAFEGLTRARAHAEANLRDAREFFITVLRDVFGNDSDKWQTDTPPDPIGPATRSQMSRSRDKTQTGGRDATLRPLAGPYSLTVLRPNLPSRKGWRWSQLTDLARLESGHTPSRKHPEYWGGDLPWIGIKDARDHHGGEIHETLENTNPLGIANSSARMLPAQTVCLSRTASVGYVTIMGRDMATSQDFVNWICGDALLPEFLKLLLLAQGNDIRRFASGSVHQTIYFPEVKAFHICHPPVIVQRQICDALEAVLEQTEALVDVYRSKVDAIDALRQSLLQKAFAGELT